MNDTPVPTCIYCRLPGPFSDEHVVPASIGADDRDWLLKGCVCRTCNTKVFSPLETKFARSSPFYLARLALQPRSRKRGSRSEAPKAQLKESLYFDPELNRILEAIVVGGGSGLLPHCLPQIHLVPDAQGKVMFSITGPDAQKVTRFLGDLRAALGDEAILVEKQDSGANARFVIHRLQRASDRYQLASSSSERQAPAGSVWYAPLAPVRSYAASTGAMPGPRVFRHQSGSLTCRSDDIETAIRVLGLVAEEISAWTVPASAELKSTAAPPYRQTLEYDHTAYCRVLAKIGLNVIAKTSGSEVMRQPYFDRARTYVLDGKRQLLMRPGGDDRIPEALVPLADTRHLIGIEVERRVGVEVVRAIFKLYGGPVHQLRLAATCGKTIGVTTVWLSIDYVNHRVQRHRANPPVDAAKPMS